MSRRPSNVSPRPSHRQPTPKPAAELVTYRLDSDMVYVNPGSDYEKAVDYAQAVFPQLEHVARERIAFSVNVRVGGELRTVRIAPMAWERVLSSLSTYEIIDLSILPHSHTRAAKSEADIHIAAFGESNSEKDFLSVESEEQPPRYGRGSLKVNTTDNNLLGADLRASEKSPGYTLQPPTSPQIKRCSSALGWLGKHF